MSTTRGHRAGHLTPTAGTTPQRPAAEAAFVPGELDQVTAEAVTVGLPMLRAKTNVEVRGVGRKFSGLYHIETVRHRIDGSGYSCELTLQRNAVGSGAGTSAPTSRGTRNAQHAPPAAARSTTGPPRTPTQHVVIDANTGQRR